MSRSQFGGNPAQRRQQLSKALPGPSGAGRGPFGSKIVPESPNANADRGSVVGGLQDASVPRSQMAGKVALQGQGRGAAKTTAPAGDMKPPTPRPGQKGRAAAHPAAPASLAMGITGKGGSAGAASGMARQALRGGGRTGPMQVRVQLPPSLPSPVHGQTQGGRKKNPGQSKLS